MDADSYGWQTCEQVGILS